MRLRQGQLWKIGDQFWRIVQVDRLSVEYKTFTNPIHRHGPHHQVTKKEFCRLIKGAIPMGKDEAAAIFSPGLRDNNPDSETAPIPSPPSEPE